MANTKKLGENHACSALFECGYYSEKYGILFVMLTIWSVLTYKIKCKQYSHQQTRNVIRHIDERE